jgi:anaerobic magnesium-protoporphyrin IX monomethyl ester cyclase
MKIKIKKSPCSRCLIISTNREKLPVPVVPLGVCLLAHDLKCRGFDVTVIDLNFTKNPFKNVYQTIQSLKPHAICLSMRNIDNADPLKPIFYLKELKELINKIKEYTSIPLIIGGPAFNIAPSEILEFMDLSYGIRGDGEKVLAQALQGILDGSLSPQLPGLVVRNNMTLINPPHRLQELGLPHGHDIFSFIDLKRYLKMGASYPIQTKRGCPRKCTYCTYYQIEGTRGRLKPAQEVAHEAAEAVRRYSPRSIEFVDSTFNIPQEHAIKICEALASKKLKVSYEVSSINCGDVSEQLFLSIKKAGFSSVILTPDSASEPVLEGLRKGFSVSDVIHAAELVRKTNIPALWSFLMGGPGETEETVKETFHFIKTKLGKKSVAFVVVGVRIYPGTDMVHQSIKEGVITSHDDLLHSRFYFSPALGKQGLIKLVKEQSRGISNLITIFDMQHPVLDVLTPVARFLRLPGPLWKYSKWLRMVLG